MAGKRPPRRGAKPTTGHERRKGARAKPPGKPDAPGQAARLSRSLRVRRLPDGVWELVLPRCARDRREDLEEVRKMLDAGEIDVAIDECRWLLEGCTELVEAHQILGEIALAENDLPLARGHFGYVYRLVVQALATARAEGPMPYRLAANRVFHESGKALAWCLRELGHLEMAAEVVSLLLRLDPSDPLGVRGLLEEPTPPAGWTAEAD